MPSVLLGLLCLLSIGWCVCVCLGVWICVAGGLVFCCFADFVVLSVCYSAYRLFNDCYFGL